MDRASIVVGQEYGTREPPRPGVELQRVRVLEPVRSGKWRVEWLEENAGLVDFVRSANIVVPWKDRKPFLKDEERQLRLEAHSRERWPGKDHPLSEAVGDVLDSTGESLSVYGSHGILSGQPDALERIATRARTIVPDSAYSFVDRFGTFHAPFDVALELARKFAAAEPNTVLINVEAHERRYEAEARELGNAYLVPLVERWRASWALCRQWAGFDDALAQRDAEIKFLRELINRTMWDLRTKGQEDLATKLERRLKRR